MAEQHSMDQLRTDYVQSMANAFIRNDLMAQKLTYERVEAPLQAILGVDDASKTLDQWMRVSEELASKFQLMVDADVSKIITYTVNVHHHNIHENSADYKDIATSLFDAAKHSLKHNIEGFSLGAN